MTDTIMELKKLLKEEKLVIGGDSVLKGLRTGKFSKIYLSANCPAQLKSDIEHYASLSDVEIVDTQTQNTELGDICKKPFSISAIGLIK